MRHFKTTNNVDMPLEGKPLEKVILSRAFSLVLLLAGTCFLLIDAFHGNIWFDESYSVAIANHSFTDIWEIGSGDVHPVLFYWALHVLYLIFGSNILVYRLFAVAGAVALASLGAFHIRRDFGPRIGVTFVFLALFTPYIAQMAVEIRMYSWVSFTVMVCALYGYRIVACLCKTVPKRIATSAEGLHTWAGIPRRWWLLWALASLTSSYLQYYGTMSAFMVNLLLLVFLLRHPKKRARAILIFFVLAALQIALYMPWLVKAVFSQVGVVSGTYWAKIVFPTTYIELGTYPMVTSQISFGLRGQYGSGVYWVLTILQWATVALAAIALVCTTVNVWRHRMSPLQWVRRDDVAPFLGALGIYLAVALFAYAASMIMNSLILYYRYLFVSIGPLLLFCTWVLVHVRPRWAAYVMLAVVLATSIINMACMVKDDYDPANQDALQAFHEASLQSDLIISSDIGFMGVTAVLYPDIDQTYMDWQKGNWGKAYEAYAVTMESEKSWELILNDFHGTFVVTGQSQKDVLPRDISDLALKNGINLKYAHTYYRPYERTYFTVALMTKD